MKWHWDSYVTEVVAGLTVALLLWLYGRLHPRVSKRYRQLADKETERREKLISLLSSSPQERILFELADLRKRLRAIVLFVIGGCILIVAVFGVLFSDERRASAALLFMGMVFVFLGIHSLGSADGNILLLKRLPPTTTNHPSSPPGTTGSGTAQP